MLRKEQIVIGGMYVSDNQKSVYMIISKSDWHKSAWNVVEFSGGACRELHYMGLLWITKYLNAL